MKNRSTSPQNIEVDSDSEPDFTPRPEQEEPELEEVTAVDDLSMLDRLRRGGLPHDDAFINDDDEHVITDSDDDDAFIDPRAFIEPEDADYYWYSIFYVVLDLYSYLYDCVIYIVTRIIFLLCMIVCYT